MNQAFDTLLEQVFALESFRPWQREAIETLCEGSGRVLVVAPTGGGKSLTYQVPAVHLPGVAVVISPLVALMEDQVRALAARGIPATFLASTLDPDERYARERAVVRGDYKLVYLAPERLASSSFIERLARADISMVAIDEAHCIAQWGHDFRPDYLRIGELLQQVRPRRVLACTATATPEVRAQILELLAFDDVPYHEVLRGFARPNLHLDARYVDGPKLVRSVTKSVLAEVLGTGAKKNGAAIVYAATRKNTETFADFLSTQGYRVGAYHAGKEASERSRVADAFADRSLDVVVATNAFGMGIDRPDIRTVIHVQPPSSIEAYYQEVGRAGRDGGEAYGLLFCSGADIALRRRLVQQGADGMPQEPVKAARAWAHFRDLLRYLDARSCRHDFVLRYFGDDAELLGGCGHCDVCKTLDKDAEASSEDNEATTLLVRKALSGVARADKRAGLLAIADMLRGVSNERTERFGFTRLSTFGLLEREPNEFVVALLRALLAAGWIDLTTHEHPVPYVTRSGGGVMKGESPARIVLPSRNQRSGKDSSRVREPREARPAVELHGEAQSLFEQLRKQRAELARANSVPAYVVALDRTLVDMALQKPTSHVELLRVHGMGPARIEQYGDDFLRVIEAAL